MYPGSTANPDQVFPSAPSFSKGKYNFTLSENDGTWRPGPCLTLVLHGRNTGLTQCCNMKSTVQFVNASCIVVGAISKVASILHCSCSTIHICLVNSMNMLHATSFVDPSSTFPYLRNATGNPSHFLIRVVGLASRLLEICFHVGVSPMGYCIKSSSSTSRLAIGILGFRTRGPRIL